MRCLLLHGLAGTPFEMRGLAEALENAGHQVSLPVLPGHGGSEESYLESSFSQWLASASQAYANLARNGPVFLAGYSLGGILALQIAINASKQGQTLPMPAGILCLATPLFLHSFYPFFAPDWHFFFLPLLARLKAASRFAARSDEAKNIAPWQGHEQVCSWRHFAQIERELPAIRRNLEKITMPLCVIQLRSDSSCHPYNALYLASRVKSPVCHLHLLTVTSRHGGHLPTTHCESRKTVSRLAVDFVCSICRQEA